MTMGNTQKVTDRELRREVKRIKDETRNINAYIRFTYEVRPLIKSEISIAGIGAMDLDSLDKFTEDLEKVKNIVKTFKYDGYELV
ncbi:hypothetical protein NH288_04845 [Anaerococcus sp. NML200537]|uniref:hypothetical protein n=1 Tax=Anaerococcus sp. NML200537 TaxID=2954485 RepID=UPI0022390005|nr:hypothetical protein [Anaerococcus sp. NML200537]MCW6701411.1 hypothetical protein [Anaerococcus sp. NML200537]